jgi:hypothetical protein
LPAAKDCALHAACACAAPATPASPLGVSAVWKLRRSAQRDTPILSLFQRGLSNVCARQIRFDHVLGAHT